MEGLTKMINKKGAGAAWLAIIIIGLFLANSAIPGGLGALFSGQSALPGQPQIQPGVPACPSTAETLTFKGFEKYTTNAIPSGRIWVNGVDQGNKSDGSTLTVPIGGDVKVVYAFDDTRYWSDYAAFKMPCAAANTGDTLLSGGAHEVLNSDTAPATNGQWTFLNSDDGNSNDRVSNNLTIGSGGTGSARMKLVFQNKKSYNPIRIGTTLPGNSAIAPKTLISLEYAIDAYDPANTKFANFDTVSNPSYLTVAQTNWTMRTYALPPCPRNQETCTIEADLLVAAKSGVNPNGGDTYRLNITIVPMDIGLKTTGVGVNDLIFGVEDNTGARLSPKKTATFIFGVD